MHFHILQLILDTFYIYKKILFDRLKSPIIHLFFWVLELTLCDLIFSCFSFTFLTFSFIFSYLSFSFKTIINSSRFSAWNTTVSMLFSLLLANIRILSCFFFLFLIMLSNFFIIPVVKEKSKVKLAPAIPIGAPTTLAE